MPERRNSSNLSRPFGTFDSSDSPAALDRTITSELRLFGQPGARDRVAYTGARSNAATKPSMSWGAASTVGLSPRLMRALLVSGPIEAVLIPGNLLSSAG